MPLLQISTNTAIEDIDQLAKNASTLTAEMLGKPESYVMVQVVADARLIFAASSEPCAHLKLKSLGLNESRTTAYSEKLCAFITQNLGIPDSRIYIEFSSPKSHLWGWQSGTF